MEKLFADDRFPITAYRRLNVVGMCIQSLVLLLLRLTWGFELAQSGFGHLTHVPATVEFFTKLGVPMPLLNVYVSGATELAGGILLIIGLGTRLISLPLIINFIVAIIAASHSDIAGAFKNNGVLAGWTKIIDDTAFPFLMLALIMLAFGAGPISLDYPLGRKMFCKHSPSVGADAV
ncbi:MAG TPA: DoxX family protein [Tepidisphaeraceae bacterium]|jgi:putative oxidoreductase|nr:DoxX family protein [Tepidisphaeraceae bacterium]